MPSSPMDGDVMNSNWTSRARDVLACIVVLGVVAPAVAILLFTVLWGLPVIVFRQPAKAMLAWGWIGFPLAFLVAPPATAFVSFMLLRLFTPRALAYLIGAISSVRHVS